MSRLKRDYEISIWADDWNNPGQNTGAFEEKRVAVIGSDTMTSQCRAFDPKLKRNVNGTNELTFKLCRKYRDNVTGEKVDNPFVDWIKNESKIKLRFKGKWYDLIVKNVSQDSNNHTYTYAATDLHIIELSKNGYGLTLDTSLMNNSGTARELVEKVLADTDWELEVEPGFELTQYLEEQLVYMTDPNGVDRWVPYSSLTDRPERFQYFTSVDTINKEGIAEDVNQGYVRVTEQSSYTTCERALEFGFYYPLGWTFNEITNYRGMCKVYTHKSEFISTLNKIVYSYNNGAVNGFTETEYITPNIIENYVTNSLFKSTSGWKGGYIDKADDDSDNNKGYDNNAIVEALAFDENGKSLIQAYKDGSYNPNTQYTPCLRLQFNTGASAVFNSGFYDNQSKIKNLNPGDKYVLLYKKKPKNVGTGSFTVSVECRKYEISRGNYNSDADIKFLSFFATEKSSEDLEIDGFAGYQYEIDTVQISELQSNGGYLDKANGYTEKEFSKLKPQIVITAQAGEELIFEDFQIFPYYPTSDSNSTPLVPTNVAMEAKAITKYYYYDKATQQLPPSELGYKSTEKEFEYLDVSDTPLDKYQADYISDRVRAVNVKQSNYFNAIQSICEAFECWAEFKIEHDETGKILSKKVVLHEYIGQPNYAGFRYGVNLKSTKRTIDSKAIVTKLIVPDNTNQYAKNGFCSISRAGANMTGENYIYNFQYYINQGMIDKKELDAYLYGETVQDGNSEGYYTKLLRLNKQYQTASQQRANQTTALLKAESNKQVAEVGLEAAKEQYEEAIQSFSDLAGASHLEMPFKSELREKVNSNTELSNYLVKIAEAQAAEQDYSKQLDEATEAYNSYKSTSDALYETMQRIAKEKEELNKAFFSQYYRFIQEGTWKGDDYTDDEKYYLDAKSTGNNSCMPKVTYTFGVIDVSSLEGLEVFEFNLADQTWVEDPEFFGYNEDGSPYREEVTITEITYSLDEADKDSVKVQNYKNQFADLFQKQTATIQSVQFAKENWNKAANFTNGSSADQAAFLQNALTNNELVLSNAGDQTVVWDKTGITVTDAMSPNKQIRIVGGAIMLRDEDGDGLGWKTGITSEGINAKIITAGQLNTGTVQIMSGEEPYFRWDSYGITAYHFEMEDTDEGKYRWGLDTSRGVRFDRMGIYGFNKPYSKETGEKFVDAASWHPDSIEEVQEHSIFALTWDGLYLNIGSGAYNKYQNLDDKGEPGQTESFATPQWHASGAKLGKTNDYLYNSWSDKGYPYYDPSYNASSRPVFAKVMTVGNAEGNENFAIYDDGTVIANNIRFTGSVTYAEDASPTRTVYGKIAMTEPPEDGTRYSSFPEWDDTYTPRWHRNVEPEDQVYARTEDGGSSWQGPFFISGKGITGSETQYAVGEKGLNPAQIPDSKWSKDFPQNDIDGKAIYTRARSIYDNGETSSWSYTAGFIGTGPIMVEVTTYSGDIYLNNQITTTLMAIVTQDNIDITNEFPLSAFTWTRYNAKGIEDYTWPEHGNLLAISNKDVLRKATFSCAVDIEKRIKEA